MGHAQLLELKMTVEEYFEMEEASDIRHEFYDGDVYAMSGTTLIHNLIVGTMRSVFRSFFHRRGCRAYAESIKLKVSDRYYLYPDVIVTCKSTDNSATYMIEHPSILVEVLSKTSNARDRGRKLKLYKAIPSLKYYLLISQHGYNVELFSRVEGGDLWMYRTYERVNDVVCLDAFDFEITLEAIYEDIEFADNK